MIWVWFGTLQSITKVFISIGYVLVMFYVCSGYVLLIISSCSEEDEEGGDNDIALLRNNIE